MDFYFRGICALSKHRVMIRNEQKVKQSDNCYGIDDFYFLTGFSTSLPVWW